MNNNQLENTQKQVKFNIQMTFYELCFSRFRRLLEWWGTTLTECWRETPSCMISITELTTSSTPALSSSSLPGDSRRNTGGSKLAFQYIGAVHKWRHQNKGTRNQENCDNIFSMKCSHLTPNGISNLWNPDVNLPKDSKEPKKDDVIYEQPLTLY